MRSWSDGRERRLAQLLLELAHPGGELALARRGRGEVARHHPEVGAHLRLGVPPLDLAERSLGDRLGSGPRAAGGEGVRRVGHALMIAPRSSTVAALRRRPPLQRGQRLVDVGDAHDAHLVRAALERPRPPASGTIISCTPFVRAVIAFCSTPPTSPTEPSGWMVPVTATRLPAGEAARREVVDDREREGEARRRSTDAARC